MEKIFHFMICLKKFEYICGGLKTTVPVPSVWNVLLSVMIIYHCRVAERHCFYVIK